ncbi:hypothetical protein GCM10027605_04010 [Micromonospora zhanjiangensis]
MLLRVLLGIEPCGDRLTVDPAMSERLGRVELLDIPGPWGRLDAFARGRVRLDDAGPAARPATAAGR